MKTLSVFTLLLLMLLSGKGFAQDKEIDKINTSLKTCTDKQSSTPALLQCISAADSLADHLLNKYYKRLLTELKNEDKEQLKQSQRAWLSYYNLEVKFIHQSFTTYANYSKYGTGMEQNIDNAYQIYHLKINRVSLLSEYVQLTTIE